MLRLLAFVLVAACGDDGTAIPEDGGSPSVDAALDAGGDRDAGGLADAGTDAGSDAGVFDGPALLSEAGLYADLASRALADGVLDYTVAVPLWTDGHDKSRFLWLPPGGVIDTSDMDGWIFPVGTRAFMEIVVDGAPVETRMLEKRADDVWVMVGYEWRADGTDADARPDGAATARGTSWEVVDRNECLQCHMGAADVLNGVSALQVAGAGGLLERLQTDGRISDAPTGPIAFPGTGDARDALAYMHVNCGQCHNDRHPLSGWRDLRLHLSVLDTVVEDTPAYTTAIGAMMSHELDGTRTGIVRGDPSTSQLWVRMGYRNEWAMPPLGTRVVDVDARAFVESWIAGL